MKARQQPLLRVAVEVDQHVAAGDQMKAAGRGGQLVEQVASLEADHAAHGGHDRERRRRREVALAQLGGRLLECGLTELAARGSLEASPIDVGAEHVQLPEAAEQPVLCRIPMAEDRERVWLLATRAAGAPDANGPGVESPQHGHDVLRHRLVDCPVPEELRDVDREGVEEPVVLGAVAIENLRVLGVGVDALGPHAHGDAASQAFLLVVRAGEAAVLRDLARQLLKVAIDLSRRPGDGLRLRRLAAADHPNTCRTDSRFVRTIAFSGSSSRARSQQRTASSRSCRLKRMLPSLRYTSPPISGLAFTVRWYASKASS